MNHVCSILRVHCTQCCHIVVGFALRVANDIEEALNERHLCTLYSDVHRLSNM